LIFSKTIRKSLLRQAIGELVDFPNWGGFRPSIRLYVKKLPSASKANQLNPTTDDFEVCGYISMPTLFLAIIATFGLFLAYDLLNGHTPPEMTELRVAVFVLSVLTLALTLLCKKRFCFCRFWLRLGEVPFAPLQTSYKRLGREYYLVEENQNTYGRLNAFWNVLSKKRHIEIQVSHDANALRNPQHLVELARHSLIALRPPSEARKSSTSRGIEINKSLLGFYRPIFICFIALLCSILIMACLGKIDKIFFVASTLAVGVVAIFYHQRFVADTLRQWLAQPLPRAYPNHRLLMRESLNSTWMQLDNINWGIEEQYVDVEMPESQLHLLFLITVELTLHVIHILKS
jgi:hypothetical protein